MNLSTNEQKLNFWDYLSPTQKDLIEEGFYLIDEVAEDHAYNFKDYSFLIFPFAKAFEGFLKKLFLDRKLISRLDYLSDHFRLGKLLSPGLIDKLGDRSLYKKIKEKSGEDLAQNIWETWKVGRNQIFHYFSHNLKAVNLTEAKKIIKKILETMDRAYKEL